MLREIGVFGIILLLLCTSFSSMASARERMPQKATSGKTWYVGGTGPGNYSVIQYAVDNASDGDTVFVYSGTYSDFFPDLWACVRIAKKISLIGENKLTTVIKGSDFNRVVIVDADGVNVSGFTLQNGGIPALGRFGVGVDIFRQRDVRIFNNREV